MSSWVRRVDGAVLFVTVFLTWLLVDPLWLALVVVGFLVAVNVSGWHSGRASGRQHERDLAAARRLAWLRRENETFS